MPKPTLILLMGLPRSGKSTYARSLGCPVVSPDAIRMAMHGERFLASAEQWVWVMARTMAAALIYAGHERVVVDATNIRERHREGWQSREWDVEIHVLRTPVEVCKQRALATNDERIIPVIERMAEQWEFPLDGHGALVKYAGDGGDALPAMPPLRP